MSLDLDALAQLESDLGHDQLPILAQIYRHSGTELIGQLSAALSGAQAEEARRTAHSLKASSRYIGAHRVDALAQSIEELAKNGDLDAALLYLGALRAAHDEACAALDTYSAQQ